VALALYAPIGPNGFLLGPYKPEQSELPEVFPSLISPLKVLKLFHGAGGSVLASRQQGQHKE
jgi:hypothetical protein